MSNKSLQDILDEQRQLSPIFRHDIGFIARSSNFVLRNRQGYEGTKWVVRSPGNDLLDFYDEFNLKLGKENRAYSAIPPSVVFHLRFRMQLPDAVLGNNQSGGRVTAIKEYCKPWKETHDNSYWGQILVDRYSWLIDEPSKQYEFNDRTNSYEFLKQQSEQSTVHCPLSPSNTSHLYLRGRLKGWSIVTVNN